MARHTLELVIQILNTIAIALLALGMGQLYIDHIRVHDASQTRNIYSKRNIAAIVATFCGAISWFTVLGMDIAKALLTEGLTTLEALHYPLVAVILSLVPQAAYAISAKHTHREGPSKDHSKPHNMLTIGCDDCHNLTLKIILVPWWTTWCGVAAIAWFHSLHLLPLTWIACASILFWAVIEIWQDGQNAEDRPVGQFERSTYVFAGAESKAALFSDEDLIDLEIES